MHHTIYINFQFQMQFFQRFIFITIPPKQPILKNKLQSTLFIKINKILNNLKLPTCIFNQNLKTLQKIKIVTKNHIIKMALKNLMHRHNPSLILFIKLFLQTFNFLRHFNFPNKIYFRNLTFPQNLIVFLITKFYKQNNFT